MTRTVILCSYGPPKATRASAQRLRAMLEHGDQLLVYAGTRRGTADVGRTTGIEAIEAIGREGLIEAIERVRGPHALHVTDGVDITARGLNALFEAAASTGKLVTPWTNDLGTDHYAGPLPTHGNTIEVLNRVGQKQPEAVVRVLRPVCVAGTPGQLMGLVAFHLSYPTTVIRLLHEDCMAVGGVAAAHDGSAQARLAEPEGPDGRPLLVASMIVRDEEDLLPGCLESLVGLVDRIDLCDTGSKDRTLEIARSFGCNIIEREWRDDFAWARNQVLEESRDAWWALWIDADERAHVDDVVRVRRELATAVDHFEAFALTLTSGEGDAATSNGGSRWTTPRILSPQRMHFVGALHEQIMRRETDTGGITTTLEGLELVHLGYSPELIRDRDKVERNLSISRSAFEADPSDPTAALHYARSMWLSGAPAEDRIPALETAMVGLRESGDAPTNAFVTGLLARTVASTDDHQRALELAQEALDLVPAEDVAFEALVMAARSLDRPDAVLERQDAYTHGPSLKPKIADPALRAVNRAEIVRLLRNAGRIDEALHHTSELLAESHAGFPHWELLIDALLDTRSAADFVEEVRDLLVRTEDGTWARPLATRVKREIALELIVAHLEAGGTDPEPVRVGLTLAMIAGEPDLLRLLATEYAHLLPAEDRRAMADRLRERGDDQSADLLSPPAAAPTFLL